MHSLFSIIGKTLLTILFILGHSKIDAQSLTAKQTTDMQQLVAEIQSKLPKDWKLEVSPNKDPHIIVYYPKPVTAVHKRALSFVLSEPKPFFLKYKLDSKIENADWIEKYNQNQKNKKLRETYKSQLDHIRNKTLKPSSIDPENYQPKTDTERNLLREYKLAWPNTKPIHLPDHSYKSLSIWSTSTDDYTFSPAELRKNYIKVENMISQVLTKYKYK